jgi:hypothetical protein
MLLGGDFGPQRAEYETQRHQIQQDGHFDLHCWQQAYEPTVFPPTHLAALPQGRSETIDPRLEVILEENTTFNGRAIDKDNEYDDSDADTWSLTSSGTSLGNNSEISSASSPPDEEEVGKVEAYPIASVTAKLLEKRLEPKRAIQWSPFFSLFLRLYEAHLFLG